MVGDHSLAQRMSYEQVPGLAGRLLILSTHNEVSFAMSTPDQTFAHKDGQGPADGVPSNPELAGQGLLTRKSSTRKDASGNSGAQNLSHCTKAARELGRFCLCVMDGIWRAHGLIVAHPRIRLPMTSTRTIRRVVHRLPPNRVEHLCYPTVGHTVGE
jgi:hypothetical protein